MTPALFAQVLVVETKKQLAYRSDFWINAVGGFVVQLAIAYYLWRAVFDTTGATEIGGYGFQAMVTYYVLAALVAKLVRADIRQMSIASDIYQGALTRYLLYPAGYLGFKLAEAVGGLLPALVQLVFLGTASVLIFGLSAELTFTLWSVLGCLAMVALGNLLSFLIAWPVQSVAFWAENVWSLNVMLRFTSSILGGLMLPMTVFPEAAQRVLDWLPFQYLYFYPVQTLLGRVSFADWLAGMGIACLWCVLTYLLGLWLWRRGLRTYTGVGI